MTNADKFQLVYVEGSRPNVKQEKEVADIKKIINNMKSLFSKIVKELIKTRRRLPEKLNIFGGQSFRLRIYLYYLDYCGMCFFSSKDLNYEEALLIHCQYQFR